MQTANAANVVSLKTAFRSARQQTRATDFHALVVTAFRKGYGVWREEGLCALQNRQAVVDQYYYHIIIEAFSNVPTIGVRQTVRNISNGKHSRKRKKFGILFLVSVFLDSFIQFDNGLKAVFNFWHHFEHNSLQTRQQNYV